MPTGLLLLAPGSSDPRHAQTLHAVTDDVRGDVEAHVALGFLSEDAPTVAEALDELNQDNRRVVAVQVTLTADAPLATHVAAALAHAPAHRPVVDAGPLEVGSWLVPLLERRAGEAGTDQPGQPVVVLATDPSLDADQVAAVAQQWSALRAKPVVVATEAELATVVDHQRQAGQSVVVVPLLLDPSAAYDRLVETTRALQVPLSGVLAPAQELTDRIVTLARGQVVLPDVSVPA